MRPQVPNKSADSILDEFLASRPSPDHTPERSPLDKTSLKFAAPSGQPKPFSSQRQRNLLFTISGDRHEPYRQPDASLESATSQLVQIQRKLIGFFFVYATIIVTLYLTYAVYSYSQQSQFRRQQQLVIESAGAPASALGAAARAADEQAADLEGAAALAKPVLELQAKLEDKIHLLERYLEVLALDLEDTKGRLREREKCACSLGCSFNGTRFSDGQRWQQKCDSCTCQAGRISCAPRECPKLSNCDDPVQLPGRCCPTCMKKCKLNGALVRHGHSFRPAGSDGKQCKCHDGLIKCEPLKSAGPQPAAAAKNRTLEYIKSILGSRNPQPQLRLAAERPAADHEAAKPE